MRIGLFTDTYYPQINGVATSVLMLRDQLKSLGHEVFVFTGTDPAAPFDENDVYRIPSFPIVADRRLAYSPLGVMKTLNELRIDLVHTHTEFSLGLLGRLTARKYGVPLIHTMHTIYEYYTHYIPGLRHLDPVKKGAVKKLSAAFCNSADGVIVPTQKTKDLMLSYGVARDIAVIPTGIDIDGFISTIDTSEIKSLRERFGIEDEHRVVVNVGRISAEKNIDEILRAMKIYMSSRADVRLLIVGEGPAAKRLEALASDLGIAEKVIFAGGQPWDEIANFYGLGRAFISASQSETQGLTYIEALASGLPVIAKNDHCLRGVLNDGDNGFIFDDARGMLRALDKLLFDESCRSRMSAQATLSAQRFSSEHFAQSVQSIYFNAKK
ncbi:MAG: glycosyltransferase family 4 protein [Clostridiales Family XIII bacterium]|nr:glycosyltransferase family 4 protein [Clostridiales Family XIII bacterium]